MTVAVVGPPPAASTTSGRADAFVAARVDQAAALGTALAEHVQSPATLAAALRDGLAGLADPAYLAGQGRVAPGLGPIHGVRRPLLVAAIRSFAAATREDRPTTLLFVADRLVHEPVLEARWFAFPILQRTLAVEPERTWQVLRRAAQEAADWITVDDLARPYATGIAGEPYRWAELEQLVFSPSRWERRLVGSTIATMTHGRRPVGFGAILVRNGLPLLGQLIGDAQPDVQKALSWAYRSLAAVDPAATTAALRREAERAAAEDDGHRAWVVRDSLPKLDPDDAAALRHRLAGVRRRSDAPSTSSAAETATRFGGLPDPATHPEPPLA